LLVESVTSHGLVDAKRHAELADLFAGSTAGPVYVTAFPNRAIMGRYLGEIAWETEVWVADAPSHLIHFNGERFLVVENGIPNCTRSSFVCKARQPAHSGLCNGCCSTADGRKDKQDDILFDRNRLNIMGRG